MDELEEKLGAILSDPKAMEQIYSMAQALGQSAPEQSQNESARESFSGLGGIDPGMLKTISGIASQGQIPSQEHNLLCALRPYLAPRRIEKLEKAMRAAKMASVASAFLGNSQNQTGR